MWQCLESDPPIPKPDRAEDRCDSDERREHDRGCHPPALRVPRTIPSYLGYVDSCPSRSVRCPIDTGHGDAVARSDRTIDFSCSGGRCGDRVVFGNGEIDVDWHGYPFE